MGRPLGSVNKPKEASETVSAIPEKVISKVAPTVAKIEPVEPKCLNCRHEKPLHYGSFKLHCNTRGCECDAYKK